MRVLFSFLLCACPCVCTHGGFRQFQDEILTVIRRVDDNWAEGMLGDKIGIFPLLYVEVSKAMLSDLLPLLPLLCVSPDQV